MQGDGAVQDDPAAASAFLQSLSKTDESPGAASGKQQNQKKKAQPHSLSTTGVRPHTPGKGVGSQPHSGVKAATGKGFTGSKGYKGNSGSNQTGTQKGKPPKEKGPPQGRKVRKGKRRAAKSLAASRAIRPKPARQEKARKAEHLEASSENLQTRPPCFGSRPHTCYLQMDATCDPG